MACGNGRHAAVMEKMGFWVTGIDLSRERLREALNRKLEKAEFFLHDIRHPFRIRYFDLVLNLHTSMGYTLSEKDNLSVIQSAAMGMKPGALLVIDFLNPVHVREHLQEFESLTIDDVVFNITRKLHANSIEKEIEVWDAGQTFIFKEVVQLLDQQNFLHYFARNGLELRTIYGNYRLDNFDPSTAERMILVAQKKHVS